ncbi:UNVERIFIED_CONTAM: FMRFamide receptor [Trichonephila clavipes]
MDPLTNSSVYIAKPSEFRMNKLYYKVYYIWLYLFVMYFIPFLTLAVLNISIWRAVQHANKDRQRLTRREEKEIGLAMMLICVVSIFFVCNILALLINILELFDLFVPALVRVSNLLVTFNSSINFVIYCIFGQKFKKMFLYMFCGFRRTKNQSFTSTLQVTHTETLRSVNSPGMRIRSLTPNGTPQSSSL